MEQFLHILRSHFESKALAQCRDPMMVLGSHTFSGDFFFCLLLIFDIVCCIVLHTNCFTVVSGAYDWVNAIVTSSLPFHHQLLQINSLSVAVV